MMNQQDTKDIKTYLDNVYCTVAADSSEFSKILLPQLENVSKEFREDTTSITTQSIRPIVNLCICFNLAQYFKSYLKTRDLTFSMISEISESLISKGKYSNEIENLLPIYTSQELLNGLRKLDDSAVRRILSNRRVSNFDVTYSSVLRNDSDTFSKAIGNDNVKKLSAEWFVEYLKSDYFREISSKLLTDKKNQELLYEFTFLYNPHIGTIIELMNDFNPQNSNEIASFLNIYPLAMLELRQELDQYVKHPALSSYAQRNLEKILKHYEFIFEDCRSTELSTNSINYEAILPLQLCLVKQSLDFPNNPVPDGISNRPTTIEHNNTISTPQLASASAKVMKNRFFFPNVVGIQEPSKKAAFLDSLYDELFMNLNTPHGHITEQQFKYLFGAYGVTQPKDYPDYFIWTGPKYQFALLLRLLFDYEEQKTAQNGFIVLSSDYEKKQSTKWTSGTNIQSSKKGEPSENLHRYASRIIEIVKQHGGQYKGELRWARDL